MSKPREILTFSYKDEYGNEHEYKTVDITGMTESQINATKARIFGQMSDYLSTGDELDSIPIRGFDPQEEPVEAWPEEKMLLLNRFKQLEEENEWLKSKEIILKEMLREAYGN